MQKIESGITLIHAKAREEGVQQTVVTKPKEVSQSPISSPDELSNKNEHLTPFAIVNSVAQISPAFHADMREGDKVLLFGSIDKSAGGLGKISSQVVEDQSISMVVKRKQADDTEKIFELTLKPSKWAGPGLLGCHLLPL